ncbi:hypothetical protein CIK05_03720 [Bdellovibrio sp. qaytius]|nr:hypothetical protein CIK05_03720 [Bdellovibrio sp. qaytius]
MRLMGVLFVLLFSLNSFAALAPRMYSIILQGGLSSRQNQDSFQNSVYSNKMDINILYFVRGGPTFGFRYLIESRNEAGSEAGEAYGPSAGYYWERGWFILGHYDILSKIGSWTNGEGPQIDFGYLEHIGGQFHIGFQVSDRTTVYKTDKTSALSEIRTVKDTYPSATLMYLF